MRRFVYLLVVFCSLAVYGQPNQALQMQLIKMATQQSEIQQNFQKYDKTTLPASLQLLATNINQLHTETLKEIVSLNGWPNKESVTEQGVKAAFSIVNHSTDLAFQQDMLPLIIQSYINQDGIAGKDVAEFTDKVSLKLGKPQVFGTQAEVVEGKIQFAPIENQANVDQLRAQMGMPPLAEFKESLERLHNLN